MNSFVEKESTKEIQTTVLENLEKNKWKKSNLYSCNRCESKFYCSNWRIIGGEDWRRWNSEGRPTRQDHGAITVDFTSSSSSIMFQACSGGAWDPNSLTGRTTRITKDGLRLGGKTGKDCRNCQFADIIRCVLDLKCRLHLFRRLLGGIVGSGTWSQLPRRAILCLFSFCDFSNSLARAF